MEEKIEILNDQNIVIKSYYRNNSSETLVIYFHGFAGWYDKCAKTIANMCDENNFSFLVPLTQGAGIINTMKCYNGVEYTSLTRGGCYEKLEDYKADYKSVIKFAKEQNYKKIILIGHSLACNKIVDYLSENTVNNLVSIILLAPQDLTDITTQNPNLLKQTTTLLGQNKEEEILSGKFLGFCDISARTFLSFQNDCFLHNLQYKNPNFKFDKFSKLNLPIAVFIGDKDEGLNNIYDAEICMQRLKNYNKNVNITILENCNHTFKNSEEKLSILIKEYLKTL